MACAQSSAVDSQSGQLSLFHLLERMQAAAFPTSIAVTVVGMVVKEADDLDSQSVRLVVDLNGTVIFDAPISFSFGQQPRNRIITALKGLGIPGAGVLSFSFLSDSGRSLGAAWTATVEIAASSATASPRT